MEGLLYPDCLWLGVHDQITKLSLLSLCELEEYHSLAHTLRRGVRNRVATLICRAVLASCLLSGASFDARDLRHGQRPKAIYLVTLGG